MEPENDNLIDKTAEKTSRRAIIKTAAVTTVGLLAGWRLVSEAEAQRIKFDARASSPEKVEGVRNAIRQGVLPLNSAAVLPDGRLANRAEILKQLNLNPSTAPEAWLNIIGCGSNASALHFRDAEQLVSKGILDKQFLTQIRRQ